MRRLFLLLSFFLFSTSVSLADTVVVPTLTPIVSEKPSQITIPVLSQYMLFGVASPAAMKCFQDGGTLRGTSGVSGPIAYCVFNKPFQIVDEWEYYRGEVKRADK